MVRLMVNDEKSISRDVMEDALMTFPLLGSSELGSRRERGGDRPLIMQFGGLTDRGNKEVTVSDITHRF